MNPDLTHVRVTVVDFMGVFLPGTTWALLLVTLAETLQTRDPNITPITVTTRLLETVAPSLGVGFYAISIVTALILGYVAKYVAIRLAEPFSLALILPVDRLVARVRRIEVKGISADYSFPYDAIHRGTRYYATLADLLATRLLLSHNEIPRGEFFGTCKRLLKLHAPSLWEEAEHREAEVRMLASLVLASFFSLLLAILHFSLTGVLSLAWILTSVASTLFLIFAYRLRRRREVRSIYFATLAALPLIKKGALNGEP